MPTSSSEEITKLLRAWSDGDETALDRLMPLVYTELRRMANRYMARERRGRTFQATALVHEAYLRLVDQDRVHWQNRTHFFAIAAQLMRRILVDHARKRRNTKRGGNVVRLPLEAAATVSTTRAAEVIALDDALKSLTGLDERKGRIVELRFFGGLSIDETAVVLGVSPGTVMRDWTIAKAWLRRAVSGTWHDDT
jgi:RNA polymerase sigma-70 factor, ECF subfamily